jgi:signal peptidase I
MSRRFIVGIAVVAALLGAAFLEYTLFMVWDARPAQAFKNVSASMAPALLPGDRFTIRVDASHRARRGDIVAHTWPPDPSKTFVKRVVGLPGDTVGMERGHLILNGRLQPEPYAWIEDVATNPISGDFNWQRPYVVGRKHPGTQYVAARNTWGPLVIPQGMYFVLGDNRDNSLDSRYWGFVPSADIVGTVRRIYFSQDSAGHLRFARFGLLPR